MKSITQIFSRNRVEDEKPLPPPPGSAPPDRNNYAGKDFKFTKDLEKHFHDAEKMYAHVSKQDPGTQKAVLENSDLMRDYLCICLPGGPQYTSKRLNYTEAPTAWATAAPLLGKATEQQRAIDNLAGMRELTRLSSQSKEFKKTVEDACVHLLENLGSLKTATVQQKALGIVSLSHQQLDGAAQRRIAEAAQNAKSSPGTSGVLHDVLDNLNQPPLRSSSESSRFRHRLSLNGSSQTAQPFQPQPQTPPQQNYGWQSVHQSHPQQNVQQEKPLPQAPTDYPSDPRGFAKYLKKNFGNPGTMYKQVADKDTAVFKEALARNGALRDYLGISYRASRRPDDSSEIPYAQAQGALAKAAVSLDNERQKQRALDNMRFRLEKHPLTKNSEATEYKKSVEDGFVHLLTNFSALKNPVFKQKAATLILQHRSNLDPMGQARINLAAREALKDPINRSHLGDLLEQLAEPAVPYSPGRTTFNAKMRSNSSPPPMQPANYYQTPPQPQRSNSTPVYSSTVQQQTRPGPTGPAAPPPHAAAAYAKSISDMRARNVSDNELVAMMNSLSQTASSIRYNPDRQQVKAQIDWYNQAFGNYAGPVNESLLVDMEGMVWAIQQDLNARRQQ